jgi:hypothetical protein
MSSPANPAVGRRELRKVIAASSAGTLIEWYDFFVYGSLAVVFAGFFFPAGEEALALLVSHSSCCSGGCPTATGGSYSSPGGSPFPR